MFISSCLKLQDRQCNNFIVLLAFLWRKYQEEAGFIQFMALTLVFFYFLFPQSINFNFPVIRWDIGGMVLFFWCSTEVLCFNSNDRRILVSLYLHYSVLKVVTARRCYKITEISLEYEYKLSIKSSFPLFMNIVTSSLIAVLVSLIM